MEWGRGSVPRVSEFYGIAIQMFYREHDPPHFHAEYAGSHAQIRIDPVEIMSGNLPTRARRLVFEWANMHRGELAENWSRARRGQPLARIEPLD